MLTPYKTYFWVLGPCPKSWSNRQSENKLSRARANKSLPKLGRRKGAAFWLATSLCTADLSLIHCRSKRAGDQEFLTCLFFSVCAILMFEHLNGFLYKHVDDTCINLKSMSCCMFRHSWLVCWQCMTASFQLFKHLFIYWAPSNAPSVPS